ncbi:MAG: hypothetical protein EPN23_00480 [Verrucomicrobia bacterium]|nr:MAG: hypothetical protein EPN23_00480 [Verrucomicrobiota bacterium]
MTTQRCIQRIMRLAALAGLVVLTGCNLEERIAWSPDGNQAAVLAEGVLRFCSTNGALSAAGLPEVTAFSWLPAGRVLFAGASVTLPTTGQNLPRTQLFVLDPALGEQAAPVAVPCAPEALPMDASYFVPSPDGQRVALAEPGSDTIALITLKTGAVELISPNYGLKNRTLPAWRGADELYFAALPQTNAARPEILRWRAGKADVFSATWTDGVVTNFLEKTAPQH